MGKPATGQELLRGLLAGPPGRAHLMGVCGVGVAGLAHLLAARGWRVSGCDAAPDEGMARWLVSSGVEVLTGHDAGHAGAPSGGGPSLLIHTAAVSEDHPEICAARAAGMTVCRRGEALAAWVDLARGVAVCGAHGKTTTACFTTRLLQKLGLTPSWCIGGSTRALGAVAGAGTGDWLVVEADESDGTLALYHPAVTVLNPVDLDHLEHFDGADALIACYRQAVRQTRSGLAFCADDPRASEVARAWTGRAIGFGCCPEASLRAVDVLPTAFGSTFIVTWTGRELGRVVLDVPGVHNVSNALGALAAALLLDQDPGAAVAHLSAVAELPARRFERLANAGGIQVVADYAHHPAEIAALVATARLQEAERIVAIFQPHRYTRTLALGADFPAAFEGVDDLVLVPVYAASEAPLAGGSAADLYARFRELRPGQIVSLARSLEEAWEGARRKLRPGDLLLVVGAGDVLQVGRWASEAVRAGSWGENTPVSAAPGAPSIREARLALARIPGIVRVDARPLSSLVFYGAGGEADLLVDCDSPGGLAALLAWTHGRGIPVYPLGLGANTWVSDLGVAGVVFRLRGDAFREYARSGCDVVVGCGWNGPALLDRLEAEGWTGLEFLEGVPGQVGGWLAMNAGAHGGEIGERVAWMDCLTPDGSGLRVDAARAGFAYRHCGALSDGRIAWRVCLRLAAEDPDAIRQRRHAYRSRRLPLSGLRTAGSVFCNPPNDFAGRLLDAAGCKGLRIGGAAVSDRHANIVVASGDASGSDILALLETMRSRVLAQSGIRLELENRMLGASLSKSGSGSGSKERICQWPSDTRAWME